MPDKATQERAHAATLYVTSALAHGAKHELNTIDKILENYPELCAAKRDYAEFPDQDGFRVLRKYFKDNPAACEEILTEFVTLSVEDLVARMLAVQNSTPTTGTIVQSATVNNTGSTIVQIAGGRTRF